MNFITNNISKMAFGAEQATDYATGRKSGNEVISKSTGVAVGSAVGLTSAAIFSVITGVGVALAPAGVPPILSGIGGIGVALSPTIGIVAGKVAEIGTGLLLNQISG